MTKTKDLKPAVILLLLAALVGVFALFVVEKSKHYPTAGRPAHLSDSDDDQILDAKTYHWKMVLSWPENFPGFGSRAEELSQAIRIASGGRLRIKVYGAGELVPALGVFDAVSSGSVQAGYTVAYYWKGKISATPFFTAIPFGMSVEEVNSWFYYGGGLDLYQKLYAPFNLIPFPAGNTGTQMGGWFNKEINSIKDLQGLKMRMPGFGGEVLKRVGGLPINIPGGELFTALKTGVIDAAEWVGPYNDLAFGFHQAAKYYYYPGWHEPSGVMELIYNKQAFEALPQDLQRIVIQATRVLNQDLLNEYTARNNQALRQLVDKYGVEVRRFPDDVLKVLREESQKMLREMAAEDEQFNEVYQSYITFKHQAWEYSKVSEHAYSEVRE